LGQKKYEEKLSVAYPDKSDSVKVVGLKRSNQPFKLSFKLEGSDLCRFSGNLVYVNPFAILNKSGANPFASESRKFPIDLNPPNERVYTIKVELPEKYTVEEIPKPNNFTLPNNSARFTYSVAKHDKFLFITAQLVYNRVIYQPEEYPSLREFNSLISSRQSELIVLKKEIN
jgi:hypothetical protein